MTSVSKNEHHWNSRILRKEGREIDGKWKSVKIDGRSYYGKTLKGKYAQKAARIVKIGGVILGSCLLITIPVFAKIGVYGKVKKWSLEVYYNQRLSCVEAKAKEILNSKKSIPQPKQSDCEPAFFNILEDLPTKEVAAYKFVSQVPKLVGKESIMVLYPEGGTALLAINIKATHIPSSLCSQQDPITFKAIINLAKLMKVWTSPELIKNTWLAGFNSGSYALKDNFDELKSIFRRCDRHDHPEMIKKKCHYDMRWLVLRLLESRPINVRHVPDHCAFADVSSDEFKNYGYWNLSLNSIDIQAS